MQKLIPTALVALLLSFNAKSQSPVLTVVNVTGSNNLTCSTQTINMMAGVSNYTAPVSYAWSNGGVPLNGASVNITTPGQYTVVAYNLANSFSVTQTFSVGTDYAAPITGITPILQNITCLSGAVSVTAAASPSIITHHFYSPGNGSVTVNSNVAIYTPGMPGTYTHVAVNPVNGCVTVKTFTVASSDNFPTLAITSQQNFMLGCGNSTVAIVSEAGNTAPNPGGAVTFTMLPPNYNQPYNLGQVTNYTLVLPGVWTAVIRDVSNGCLSKIPFSVLPAALPVFNYYAFTNTLSCSTPTLMLNATPTASNLIYYYTYPSGIQYSVNSSMIVSVTPGAPLVSGYSLTATNLNNSCSSTMTIPIYQNVFTPHASISQNQGYTITCNTPTVVLNNSSTTGIPLQSGFTNTDIVAAALWEGPSPQVPLNNSSAYTAATPGVYTLTVKDLNNGCTSKTVTTISDGRIYPYISASTLFGIYCPDPTVLIYPTIIGATTHLTYTWMPANVNTASLSVNAMGTYSVAVSNTVSGCSTATTIVVQSCTGIHTNSSEQITVNVFPNPGNGVFTVTLNNVTKNTGIAIYNMLGTLVKKQAVDSEITVIDVKNEPNGIYFITVTDKNKIVHTSKIVKQ